MRIEFCAIDLKRLHAGVVAWPNLDAIVEALFRRIAKPHPQSLLGELLMTEIIRQAKNARHVATAHFRGRFADFAIERGILLDNEHTRGRIFAPDHEPRGRTGKSAADDHDIIIELHRR